MGEKEKPIKEAEEYFNILSRNFPVMCSSDEFYFFPRADVREEDFFRLDSLDRHVIQDSVRSIKGLLRKLERSEDPGPGQDIDSELIKNSMKTFLREFGLLKTWESDPRIYLKVILFGVGVTPKETDPAAVSERIKGIPALLSSAMSNIKAVSPVNLEVSLEAADTSAELVRSLSYGRACSRSVFVAAADAITEFKGFLKKVPCNRTYVQGRDVLESILRDTYGSDFSCESVLSLGEEEYRKSLAKVISAARKIDPSKGWEEVEKALPAGASSGKGIMDLYRKETARLESFIRGKNIVAIPGSSDLRVLRTPGYLAPLRSAASYSAASGRRKHGIFYIRFLDGERGRYSEVHKEHVFICSHETYPGHHLLDTFRRGLGFIRRQIESPCFYEGWACYSEELIQELGYDDSPAHSLIAGKRRLWRAIRCMLDVGLHTGSLTLQQAVERLMSAGYSRSLSYIQARHYALTPGYQLCYTLGREEIMRLRQKFVRRTGLRRFHDLLLGGGQIPFRLAEKSILARLQEGAV